MAALPADVVDRLEQLAAHAPGGGIDPDVVWTHGRRRQRVRVGAVVAALVAVGLLGTTATPVLVERAQRVEPADSADRMVLPDLIRQPGGWEPAFPSAPGRLVAVGLGTRAGWWSSRGALWGVSAATGESRFLDLPDAAATSDSEPALSADGRRLAYWFTDDDVELLPADLGPDDSMPVRPAGVAVVELATGDIERWDTEAPYGLDSSGLAWAGDVLWWTGGPVEPVGEIGSRSRARTHTWDVGTGERRRIRRDTPGWDLPLGPAGPAPDGFVAGDGRRLEVVRGDRRSRSIPLASRIRNATALSPDGAEVAAILDPDSGGDSSTGEPDPVVVGDLDESPTVLSPVDGVTSTAVFGWRSPDEVVIETHRGGDMERVYGASVVDVHTAKVRPLIDFRGNVPSFAADAWSAEVIEAPDAPWAPDPRLTGAFLLVVGAFVVSLVNSIRRRRGHP